MADPAQSCCPPDLALAVAAFQRHAFEALLASDAPHVADIAETASRHTPDVAQAVAWLEAHGQLERDGDLLVGAHGLTRRSTSHTLTIWGRNLHTWCAYDAVAIPAALGATARATTSCPICYRTLTIDTDAGQLPTHPTPVLWLPTGPCNHVIDDFCAHANLFCTPDHLDIWRQTTGNPPGRVATLAEIPALARTSWADIAAHP